ncbi:MAG TPA: FlgD immunoglobulin-like domain containing protein [Candidatus Edwardsbacteria bacterium]|nr:FlgD immunoglobulin-like domain containing protein [Candidatus Edwardsbacteria bacterium]
MKRFIVIAALVACCAGGALAVARPRHPQKAMPRPAHAKAAVDTLFFDNFETDTMGWDTMDMAVQKPYWHIDTYCPVGAYSGHHWWCGTATDTNGWATPPGYGNGWVQMLYSPDIDLSAITSDSVQLNFEHYYSVESPSGGSDWDCVNLWGSTDGGATWSILYPDTVRMEGHGASGYNLRRSYAWTYTGMVPDTFPVPGWGATNNNWMLAAFDLTPFKGQHLKLRFAVCSDPLTSDENSGGYHGAWYIDNVAVDTLSSGGGRAHYFFDDAESGNIGWTAGSKTPKIHWHKTNYRFNSSSNSWYCGNEVTKKYEWGCSDAIVSPFIDLREVQRTTPCLCDFMHWSQILDNGSDANTYFDSYTVDISADSGKSWTGINTFIYIDSSATWSLQSVNAALNLNNYVGKVVKIRVGFNSDGDFNVAEGLYVDDFIITGKTRDPLPGPNPVLLVDNDANAVDVSENSWTKYFEAALADIGCRASIATIGANKPILPGYLEQFPAVVWNLGASYTPLAANDVASLLSYLSSGGKLWISGQYYLSTNPDTTVHPNLWTDYLHLSANGGWGNPGTNGITGASGDAIGDGFAEALNYDRLNGDYVFWTAPWYAYSLVPDSTALPHWTSFMKNDDSSCCGLRYWDGTASGYKFVYTSFPFEAINSPDRRDTLLARTLGWLTGRSADMLPPAVPTGLTAVQSYDSVLCRWRANSEPDLGGYEVYRALQTGLPVWVKIGTVAAPETTFADTAIQAGAVYWYTVCAFDTSSPGNYSGRAPWVYLQPQPWSKMGSEGWPSSDLPRHYALAQSQPNPVGDRCLIQFALPQPGTVRLELYNVAGQRVRTLASGSFAAGYHRVAWDGRGDNGARLTNGVYLYRLDAAGAGGGSFTQTKRLMLVK